MISHGHNVKLLIYFSLKNEANIHETYKNKVLNVTNGNGVNGSCARK